MRKNNRGVSIKCGGLLLAWKRRIAGALCELQDIDSNLIKR
jgi:hypothetical protein